MAVKRAVEALRKLRQHSDLGSEDDIHLAASYALIYLAEHTASEMGTRLIKEGIITRRPEEVSPQAS